MAGLIQNQLSPYAGMTTALYRNISSGYSSFVPADRSRSLFRVGGYGTNLAADTDKAQAFAELKDFSIQLKEAADQLVSGYPPLMEQMVAAMEEHAEAVELSETNSAELQESKRYTVEVSQLAAAQRNTGDLLPTDRPPASPGLYALNINGNTLDIEVRGDDDTQALLDRLTEAINSGDNGVTARVGDFKGMPRLILEGETGEANAFTVADEQGGLAAALGITEADNDARDAIFTVNGEERRNASNEADVAKGLNVTLRAVTEGQNAVLNVRADEERIAPAVRDMVRAYNGFLQSARDHSALIPEDITERLTNAVNETGEALSAAGIYADAEGFLTIDETRLPSAIQDGSLKEALGGGFAKQLGRTAGILSKNPASFTAPNAARLGLGLYTKSAGREVSYAPRGQGAGILYEAII